MPTRQESIAELKRLDDIEFLKSYDAQPDNMANLLPYEGAPEPEQAYEFSPSALAVNIPGSVGQLAADVTYPIRHPIKTAEGMTELFAGLIRKAVPGGEHPDEAKVDALVEHFKQRYGGTENILKTLENDPAGFLSDVSAVFTGGATLAGKPGSTFAKVSAAADPINLVANTAKTIAKGAVSKSDPIAMMQQAVKFSPSLDKKLGTGARRRLAETMLEHKIRLNDKGVDDLSRIIDEINSEIDKIIDTPEGRAGLYPAEPNVTQHIQGLKNQYGRRTDPDPVGDTNIINETVDKWRIPLKSGGDAPWSMMDFQNFKKAQYKRANYNKNIEPATHLQNETYKALGRGAKDTISDRFPRVRELNEDVGRLYELQDPHSQAVGRTGNRDAMGIGTPIKTTAGAQAGEALLGEGGGKIGAAFGYAKGLYDTPAVKSKAAQKIYDLQRSSVSDIYKSNGLLPLLTRAMFSNVGQGADIMDKQGLLDAATWNDLWD